MKYFNVKVKVFSGELKKDGEPKFGIKEYNVYDEIADGAITKLREYLAESGLDYEISKVVDTKIEAVIK